jgi:hypothetical protein
MCFPSLGIHSVEGLFLVGALFPFDGGGEEKEREKKRGKKKKKKITTGKEGFLGAGPTLLAVQRVAAIRCN